MQSLCPHAVLCTHMQGGGPGHVVYHTVVFSEHALHLPCSCRFAASNDKRLQRLRPFAQSPVVWFRNPYAHIILVRRMHPGDVPAPMSRTGSRLCERTGARGSAPFPPKHSMQAACAPFSMLCWCGA